MPRPTVDTAAAIELGEHLTKLYEDAGRPGFDRMAKELYKKGINIAGETLRKMHRGKVDPNRVETLGILLVLLEYYGVGPRALGPTAAERLEWARTLDPTAWPWIKTLPGQGRLWRRDPQRRRAAARTSLNVA